jgi:hypothetical protein
MSTSWEDFQQFFAEHPNGAIYRNPEERFYKKYDDIKSVPRYVDGSSQGASDLFNIYLGAKSIYELGKALYAGLAKAASKEVTNNFLESITPKNVAVWKELADLSMAGEHQVLVSVIEKIASKDGGKMMLNSIRIMNRELINYSLGGKATQAMINLNSALDLVLNALR